jgi:hypothetical protein
VRDPACGVHALAPVVLELDLAQPAAQRRLIARRERRDSQPHLARFALEAAVVEAERARLFARARSPLRASAATRRSSDVRSFAKSNASSLAQNVGRCARTTGRVRPAPRRRFASCGRSADPAAAS